MQCSRRRSWGTMVRIDRRLGMTNRIGSGKLGGRGSA